MLAVGLAVLGLAIAATLTLKAFKENMMFFVDISNVVAGDYPKARSFRIGGLVVDGSIKRTEGSLEMQFRVTDLQCELRVRYVGVLPDLFREGQGVVAHGKIANDGVFDANKILAKHDENYMAPEVAESLAKHVEERTSDLIEKSSGCDAL
jgi:cytochrome c-type biogenesis protein CcmE